MSAFTKCFRPVSNYPTDFSGLAVWLRADSGVTFNIPTKRVSAWSDKSGNSNDVVQATVSNQPLREGYGGQNDKAYFSFDGATNYMVSTNNSPIKGDFTIFEVSKINTVNSSVFGYSNSEESIVIGTDDGGLFNITVNNGYEILSASSPSVLLGDTHISVTKKSIQTIDLEYYDNSNSITETNTNSEFDPEIPFNLNTFTVGMTESTLLNGNIQELIIYNRALSATEITNVKGYLNLKYKIY